MADHVDVSVITEGIVGPDVQVFGPVPGGGILGGLAITGFVEVEKLLSMCRDDGPKRTVFLEKKLPFQIFIMDLEPSELDCDDGDHPE